VCIFFLRKNYAELLTHIQGVLVYLSHEGRPSARTLAVRAVDLGPVIRLKVVSEHVRQSIAAIVPPVGIQLATVDAAGVKVPGTWSRALARQFRPSVGGKVTCEEIGLSFHAVVALKKFVRRRDGVL
jgi:hypothetical protein